MEIALEKVDIIHKWGREKKTGKHRTIQHFYYRKRVRFECDKIIQHHIGCIQGGVLHMLFL